MRVALIGRTEILYETAGVLINNGHSIVVIITAFEAPEYTKKSFDFSNLADGLGIPFGSGHKIENFKTELIEANADIGVSMNYTGIIPQSIIDIFPNGILNAHGGDLPRYRGNAWQAWAILNGEKRIGLCIHKMIGGELDNGDIIERDYVEVSDTTKIDEVWNWMRNSVPQLFSKALKNIGECPEYILEAQSENKDDILRCYPRLPEDGQINWNLRIEEILRLINATSEPYSGAYCYFESEKMIIWDATIVNDDEIFMAVPGQITLLGTEYVEVACGNGKLRLNTVELGNYRGNPRKIIKSSRARLK